MGEALLWAHLSPVGQFRALGCPLRRPRCHGGTSRWLLGPARQALPPFPKLCPHLGLCVPVPGGDQGRLLPSGRGQVDGRKGGDCHRRGQPGRDGPHQLRRCAVWVVAAVEALESLGHESQGGGTVPGDHVGRPGAFCGQGRAVGSAFLALGPARGGDRPGRARLSWGWEGSKGRDLSRGCAGRC